MYRREDGLVIIDPEKAAGMADLPAACPYGAIFWNEALSLPQKCTGCAHLLDNGAKVPRCVEACPTDALRFGEEAELADLLKDAVVLHPEHGTSPRVYYRNIPGCFVGGLVYDPEEEEVVIGAAVTLTLADGTVCQPADLTVLDPPSQGLVTLREGKYHQVKRMLAARGKPVTYLKRLSMGPLTLDPALPAGAWRPLTPEEKASLGR